MSDQNNTPPPPNVEFKFQMQAMTKMMERMNFMMGNVCDKLEKVGKHGNMAGPCTQDVRKVGTEPNSNDGSGDERPRWVDYENFEADVDDINDGGFKDETIGYREGFWQLRNRRDFGYKTRGQFGQSGTLRSVGVHDDSYWEAKKMEDDIDSMRQQISGADRRDSL